jgi:hypothetical protein
VARPPRQNQLKYNIVVLTNNASFLSEKSRSHLFPEKQYHFLNPQERHRIDISPRQRLARSSQPPLYADGGRATGMGMTLPNSYNSLFAVFGDPEITKIGSRLLNYVLSL